MENDTINAALRAIEIKELGSIGANKHGPGDTIDSTVFKVSLDSLQEFLMTSFRVFKKYDQCVDWCTASGGLPPAARGGAYIIAFAVVKWSPERRKDIDALESKLRSRNALELPMDVRLWDEIVRFQENWEHLLTKANECLNFYKDESVYNAPLADMMDIMYDQNQHNVATLRNHFTQLGPGKGIALITQYYQPHDKITLADIEETLLRNLQNTAISDIYLLTEAEFNFSSFPYQKKIHQYVIGNRLTFRDALEFANKYLENRLVILANSDISFDSTLMRLAQAGQPSLPHEVGRKGTMLALLKWTSKTDDSISITMRIDSQDAWMFRAPFGSPELLKKLDFNMGLPRCDNRLVHLLQSFNHTVLNPAFSVHAIEIQSSRRIGNTLYGTKNAVHGAISNLLISDRFVI